MRKASTAAPSPPLVDLDAQPGHHIRRLQQIAVAIFLQKTEAGGVTPVQFAALQTVANVPGIDQRTLARTIAFDTSTIAGVIDRLEARGLLRRNASAADRRVRQLTVTSAGGALLAQIVPGMLRAQERILAPLAGPERAQFVRLLRKLVLANNALSRAPGRRG